MKNLAKIIEKDAFLKNCGKVLLACSGGMDSMCLADLLYQAKIPFEIAHINYRLRGRESDEDHDFVLAWAWSRYIVVHSCVHDLSDAKGNIQAMARAVRYDWFRSILRKTGIRYLATAHHADDLLEGAIFKWIRGVPWEERHLMPANTEDICRPLLEVRKEDIVDWVKIKEIDYREDSSNLSDEKYVRNFIRLTLLPQLEERRPGFKQDLLDKTLWEDRTRKLFHWMVRKWGEDQLEITSDGWELKLNSLQNGAIPEPAVMLNGWLRQLGVHQQLAEQILQAGTGAQWDLDSGVLLLDREKLLFRADEGDKETAPSISILEPGTYTLDKETRIVIEKAGYQEHNPAIPNELYLDGSVFPFPWTLRHWKPGDRMRPIGMNGHHKKVQDIFTDQKRSRFEKSKAWLLFVGGELIWIPGIRSGEQVLQNQESGIGWRISFLKSK